MNRDRVQSVIYSALAELNDGRSTERRIDFDGETVLLGPDGILESVEVVNLIVAIEVLLEEQLDVLVELADDPGLWQSVGSIRTVDSFTSYVIERLKDKTVRA